MTANTNKADAIKHQAQVKKTVAADIAKVKKAGDARNNKENNNVIAMNKLAATAAANATAAKTELATAKGESELATKAYNDAVTAWKTATTKSNDSKKATKKSMDAAIAAHKLFVMHWDTAMDHRTY